MGFCTALATAANAQSVIAPTVTAPKYVNVDSGFTTIRSMNKILLDAMAGYQQTGGDAEGMETTFMFTSATSQPIRVVYASKYNRGSKVISRISIVGDLHDLEMVYKNLFNSSRKIDVNKHTYQLDYFDYNGKKHYVRFDPDTEDNANSTDWVIIIGKY